MAILSYVLVVSDQFRDRGHTGLKVRLEWFDRTKKWLSERDEPADLGNDCAVISKLGLPINEDVNNGMFELRQRWLPLI
ncbi:MULTISPECIES: cloacin immunity family protein [Pseudomonas]|uniref:cloacin immunity family protein n=1 Tax=Pseudomonas TaxID=286 RepID=UPI0021D5370D|nr:MULTISPECIES: cloacin immunity family protein [Pseudomonas]